MKLTLGGLMLATSTSLVSLAAAIQPRLKPRGPLPLKLRASALYSPGTVSLLVNSSSCV